MTESITSESDLDTRSVDSFVEVENQSITSTSSFASEDRVFDYKCKGNAKHKRNAKRERTAKHKRKSNRKEKRKRGGKRKGCGRRSLKRLCRAKIFLPIGYALFVLLVESFCPDQAAEWSANWPPVPNLPGDLLMQTGAFAAIAIFVLGLYENCTKPLDDDEDNEERDENAEGIRRLIAMV